MIKAKYYKKIKEWVVQCVLCPNLCTLTDSQFGKCNARKNVKGELVPLSYGLPVSMNIDPVEKKPLFHFIPGSKSFSIGMAGCNFHCLNCQNWEISQISPPKTEYIEPKKIVELAIKNKCDSIAYTYTEPLVAYEYVIDIAKIAKKKGIKNIIVSNGYINKEPLVEISKYLDGANIDLKGFSEKFYKDICCGSLKPVLESLKTLKSENVFLEITNLLIPSLNDKSSEIKKMCEWIVKNLGKEVPLHFSRFFPYYKLTNIEVTPQKTLEKAKKIAEKSGLRYVYVGNIFIEKAENTYCPKCGRLLIERYGFQILQNNVKKGKCGCSEKISGVW